MNLTTYSAVVQSSSQILAEQQRRHKVNFSSPDLTKIIEWINTGAPDN